MTKKLLIVDDEPHIRLLLEQTLEELEDYDVEILTATNGLEALEMIQKDPKKSFEIMGADVKQTGEAFEGSQKFLRWQDRAANQKFFAGEHAAFSKEAADLLLEAGIIKSLPDMSKLADTRFLK